MIERIIEFSAKNRLLVLLFTNMLGVVLNPMVLASIGLIETIFQL